MVFPLVYDPYVCEYYRCSMEYGSEVGTWGTLLKASVPHNFDTFWTSARFPIHTRHIHISTVYQILTFSTTFPNIYMGVGTIGYLIILPLTGNPGILKSS